MSERDIQVGLRLKNIRLYRRMTQKELADKLKISQTAIALWENGNRSLSLDAIDDISRILNVSAGYLLFGEKDVNDIFPSEKPSDSNKHASTRATHSDGDDYTEEELKKIIKELKTSSKAEEGLAILKQLTDDLPERAEQMISYGKGLLESIDRLNEAGQQKVKDYADDLAENPRYRKASE